MQPLQRACFEAPPGQAPGSHLSMRRSVSTVKAMAAEPDPTLAPKEPETRVPLSIEKGIAALAMAALCLITLGNVIARYLTNYSFAFTEEYSIALMVVVTLLGAGIATAADRQIRITFFVDLLPAELRRWAEVVATIAVNLMFTLLIVLGGRV